MLALTKISLIEITVAISQAASAVYTSLTVVYILQSDISIHVTHCCTALSPGASRASTAAQQEACQPLTRSEQESLFVATVEAYSAVRTAACALPCGAVLMLPVVGMAVREALEAVLCSQYSYLVRGGQEGAALLAQLHAEVADRFVPAYYYTVRSPALAAPVRPPTPPAAPPAARPALFSEPAVAAAPAAAAAVAVAVKPAGAMPAASSSPLRERALSGSNTGAHKQQQQPQQQQRRQKRWGRAGAAASSQQRELDITGAGSLYEAFYATSAEIGFMYPQPASPQVRAMVARRQRAQSCPGVSRRAALAVVAAAAVAASGKRRAGGSVSSIASSGSADAGRALSPGTLSYTRLH
jgi:hypothetical protein